MARLAPLEQLERLETLETLERLEPTGRREPLVRKDCRVSPVQLELPVQTAPRDLLVLQVPLVLPVSLGRPGPAAPLVRPERSAPLPS
jgi:hypothetical protein